jgi:hypothetical protein
MYGFLSGVVAAGFLIAALFFFRFWKSTRDWLFAIFGVSFILFAMGQLAVAVTGQTGREDQFWVYLFRLAGFALLLIAIIAKNLPRSEGR